ncbi:hypothetical protein [Leptolyngbya ohadii]|uniref:hypothetical protein n=1 Tax=Leptolyngbya ohadii TaxID=1962290 RepID=UPI000B5A1BF9|nr:hypothetical protein [Leptolyngbya ohadii]
MGVPDSPASRFGLTADPPAETENGVQVIASPPPVQPGQEGWLREADLLPLVALDVPPDRADCPPAAQPSPSP